MPHEEVRERNIDHVLETAYTLFAAHGIENTTKEMLVRASKVSRSSIDRYFQGKPDCVIQTAQWVKKNIRDANDSALKAGIDGSSKGIDKLKLYLVSLEELLYNQPQLFVLAGECRAFVYRNTAAYPDGARKLYQVIGSSEMLRCIFADGIRDGSIRPLEDPGQEAIMVRESYLGFLISIAMSFSGALDEKQPLVRAYQSEVLGWYQNRA